MNKLCEVNVPTIENLLTKVEWNWRWPASDVVRRIYWGDGGQSIGWSWWMAGVEKVRCL